MQLRAHRLVAERREGRQVLYHLRQPDIAIWLAEAMRFIDESTRNHHRDCRGLGGGLPLRLSVASQRACSGPRRHRRSIDSGPRV